jgi:hypothetical protein
MVTAAASSENSSISSTSSSTSSRFESAEGSLVQALSGVLLMLLTGDAGQGALLAPGNSLAGSTGQAVPPSRQHRTVGTITPDLALSLQQLQYKRLTRLQQQGAAAKLLRISSIGSMLQQQQEQQQGFNMLESAQLKVRFEQVSVDMLQQVMRCCDWAAAASRAEQGNTPGVTTSSPVEAVAASSSSSRDRLSPTATAGAAAAEVGLQQLPCRLRWGPLKWLSGRAAAGTPATASPPSQQQLPQQQQAVAGVARDFDWPQLVHGLQQVAQSAEGCVRVLQQQSRAPPPAFLCPISHELMSDPVVACDGHTYERKAIAEWIQVSSDPCPLPQAQPTLPSLQVSSGTPLSPPYMRTALTPMSPPTSTSPPSPPLPCPPCPSLDHKQARLPHVC